MRFNIHLFSSSKFKLLLFSIYLMGLSSCHLLYPTRMLTTPPNFKFDTFADSLQRYDYRIVPNDEISMRIVTHDGEKMLETMAAGAQGAQGAQGGGASYLVEYDGMVNLPILKRVKISGMTLREAESFLEAQYVNYLNKPFVQVKVTNNRVIIFPGGEGGTAKVLTLQNTNTTIFEALAMSGGISDGKSNNIKLIRGDLKNPKIYKIDLSTIEGVKKANLLLQANDIIYVQPRSRVPQRLLAEAAPYISLFTTALLVYSLFK